MGGWKKTYPLKELEFGQAGRGGGNKAKSYSRAWGGRKGSTEKERSSREVFWVQRSSLIQAEEKKIGVALCF